MSFSKILPAGSIISNSAVGRFFSGNLRENLVGHKIRHAGKCHHDGQIEYHADTHHDYENEICGACIRAFRQDYQSRNHRHEQPDDNDYRQQNHITVNLAEIQLANLNCNSQDLFLLADFQIRAVAFIIGIFSNGTNI